MTRDIGAALRSARERRGLSLADLSATTKISVTILWAIEQNHVDKLPGGVFLRGFLRSYAREVGLDAEETVEQYLAQFDPPTEPDTRPADAWLENAAEPGDVRPDVSMRVAFVGVILALGLLAHLVLRDGPSAGDVSAAASTDDSAAVDLVRDEVATSGASDSPAASSAAVAPVRLDMQAEGLCWVSATADGERVVQLLMQPGDRRTIEAREAIELRVGDPATFTYRINDLPGRTLGTAGRPVSVRITPQNYRDFVVP